MWHAIRVFWHRFQLTRWLLLLFLSLFLVASIYFTYKAKTANVGDLKATLQTKTIVYDSKDQKAGELYSQKGTYVSLDKISPEIQNAVISTEDRSFYTNPGFSIKGILRAAVGYVIHHGEIVGGGSTITQQLAKNALLTQKQTLFRKVEELFLAIEITHTYSKKDILTMYLNNAYFGNGVWGVQDASRRYFGQNASQLDASKGAAMAAMLRSPSYYNPVDHLDNATSRRNLILGLMVDNKKLTQSQANAAKREQLVVKNTYTQGDGYKYPYYFDAVINEAISRYGLTEEEIMNKGYKIYTSLNQTYQTEMQTAFDDDSAFPTNASDGTKVQSSSIAFDPSTGGVVAVVGGRGTHVFRGFNRATQMKRSPGSTIKPLAVYTPALENGFHYDSNLTDKKISYGSTHYTPTNPTGEYLGQVPMYEALAQSLNAPAVWTLNKIGLSKGVKSVEKFGINVPKKNQHLGLALGDINVSPYQMAHAYTAFANNGKMADDHFITKIVDATGATIVDNTKVKNKTVLSKSNATEMTSMMMDVFKGNGTGASAKPDGYTVAGKTGSTQVPNSYGYGTKDQWLVGYTPDIVVATWIGFDQTDQSHFLQGTSESGVAKIWKLEMEDILPSTPNTKFTTNDAQSIAEAKSETKNKTTSSAENWVGNLKDSINEGVSKASQWFSQLKGAFGN
ncbi:PBP1A family penicillin-binding protein [Lactobacillus selangorensis]|nr:PBP1A family penicillin-binding protein [Lactobacillus selangorensis]